MLNLSIETTLFICSPQGSTPEPQTGIERVQAVPFRGSIIFQPGRDSKWDWSHSHEGGGIDEGKMPKNVISAVVSVAAFLAGTTSVLAWDATFPRGPVRTSTTQPSPLVGLLGPTPLVGLLGPTGAAQPSFAMPASGDFGIRTVPYPTTQGIDLGSGWDLILNQKQYASCVEFEEGPDKDYQTVEMRLQEVTDDDTLDITLNAQFAGSVGGNIEGIDAKADATTTINGSHHIASKDITFTAHASVTSGIRFTGPIGPTVSKSVRLTPAMTQLAGENPVMFRKKCGDGFVSSIGNGADLYLLLHFHDLESRDRWELAFNSKASAGMGDVFSATGSSDLKTTIDRLSREKKLDISFIQQGGKIEKLPTTLEESKTQVQDLAKGEFTNPRRIYATIVPYSRLPNWPPYYLIETSNLQQRAIRYIERLNSVIFEAQNIRVNLYRDRANGDPDQYYYYYRHQFRAERPSDVADEASKLRQIALDAHRKLNRPPCSSGAVGTSIPATRRRSDREAFLRRRTAELRSLKSSYDDCAKIGSDLVTRTSNFDDLSLWIKLPIPINAITSESIAKLDDLKGNLAERKSIFAQNVFRHWVERQNQVRCRLLYECLSTTEMDTLYKSISSALPGINVTAPVRKTVRICIAEENKHCPGYARSFGCPFNGRDQEAGKAVCSENGKFFAGTRRVSTESGIGQCGRSVADVDCYSYSEQPTLPNGP